MEIGKNKVIEHNSRNTQHSYKLAKLDKNKAKNKNYNFILLIKHRFTAAFDRP